MRESTGTFLTQALPYNDRPNEEPYSPMYPSDSAHLATVLTSFKHMAFLRPPRQDSSHNKQTQHKEKQKQQMVQTAQLKQFQRKSSSSRVRHLQQRVNESQNVPSTKASLYEQEKSKLHSSELEYRLDETAQAREWLFEIEKEFPGLRNFQPDPLVEPFGDPDISNARDDGNFVSLGREAYVYSAYLDDRRRSDVGVFVRVIALMSQKSATASMYSRTENEDISSAEKCDLYEMCENHSKFYGGYIFSCPIYSIHSQSRPNSSDFFSPDMAANKGLTEYSLNISSILLSLGKFAPQIRIPVHTVRPDPSKIPFLDSNPSENLQSHSWYQDVKTSKDSDGIRTGLFVPPSELLHDTMKEPLLQHQQQQPTSYRLSFAVCVSPLFGDIPPSKLVEFIELSRILGADHFYMYNFSIPASVSLLLEHYKTTGLVTVMPFKFPAGVRKSWVWYHGQLLANNDCLYRTMSRHDLVAFNDLDEFIIPHPARVRTWSEAFSSLLTNDRSGFSFQSTFFHDSIPSRSRKHETYGSVANVLNDDLITTRKTSRTRRLSTVRTKVMLCPWRVFEVGIHHISKQNREEWLSLSVDPSLAILHHYRPCVPNLGMRCDAWFTDSIIPDRYGDQLVPRVGYVLKQVLRGRG
ncbi:UPF0392 protein F13G3.3 [Elysia marginata]|uniref:Glycosyltransferase family 92 protein n=1 Tax=Elysia marginata TaxID=1093978 RepID=A0AAV4HNX2_9GAST|nr:UPF0392 protein F13G3.3 [Elysia marginata]